MRPSHNATLSVRVHCFTCTLIAQHISTHYLVDI
jgi:hypothetical protein